MFEKFDISKIEKNANVAEEIFNASSFENILLWDSERQIEFVMNASPLEGISYLVRFQVQRSKNQSFRSFENAWNYFQK